MFLVRLACVRHAASVRPEPGSNSPLKKFNQLQLNTIRFNDSCSESTLLFPTSFSFLEATTTRRSARRPWAYSLSQDPDFQIALVFFREPLPPPDPRRCRSRKTASLQGCTGYILVTPVSTLGGKHSNPPGDHQHRISAMHVRIAVLEGERPGSNRRPPGPQPGALTD